jgi:glutamate-5-semialdehyde dehydrogenase
MDEFQSLDLKDLAGQAHQASANLAQTARPVRDAALKDLAAALTSQQDSILEANTLDLESTRDLAIADMGLQWLKLTPERLNMVRQFVEQLAGLSDPLQIRSGTVAHSLHSLNGFRVMPLGVIVGLYEFLPEFPILLASLCLKTGNSLLLQGSADTYQTHRQLCALIESVLQRNKLDARCFHGLPSERSLSPGALTNAGLPIDLAIPYGRPSFMRAVRRTATVPVLEPAIGNCYLFWSSSGSSDFVRTIIVDSHNGTPDAVNAIEKVIVTPNTNFALLNVVFNHLREKGFTLKGDEVLTTEFPELVLAEAGEWSTPYLSKTVAFKVVQSMAEGIQWINRHSSGQADGLVTDSYRESQQFTLGITSATVFINASPRFSRLVSGHQGTPALAMVGRHSLYRGAVGMDVFLKRSQIVQGVGSNVASPS